jgi:serine/threonine protein kinase
MMELEGQSLAEFEIVSKVGHGGMGTVYAARQKSLNRRVAVKVLSPHLAADASFIQRFQREATTAAGFSHPGIVQVFSAGECNGIHYIAMEFVEGESLRDRIAREGRIEPREALAIVVHVAQALSYAWERARMVHRDIKPGNILLAVSGQVKVVDFGMVKCLDSGEHITSTGLLLGTPHYISPEQARSKGDIDFRADIYGLGCTLYHMLSGRVPYEGGHSLAVMFRQVNDPPPSISDLVPDCPPAVAALLNRMLAKDPDQRHRSYDELIAEVTAAHDQLQPPPVSAAAPSRWRPRVCALAAVVAMAAVAGMFAWAPWKKGRADPARIGQPFVASIGMELVYLPPGEFLLGSTPEDQAWAMDNGTLPSWVQSEGREPRKAAIKAGFWIGKTEVTVGQWKQFVTATGYVTDAEKQGTSNAPLGPGQKWDAVKGANWRNPNFGFQVEDYHPVSCISWNDAVAFCNWLNQRESRDLGTGRLPAGYQVRLPTEAEWEYACRAGTQTRFWWGDSPHSAEPRLNLIGSEDGFEFVSPVDHFGKSGRNGFGLADMLGNLSEWCLDGIDPAGAHAEFFGGVNPIEKAYRGASFNDKPATARCAFRYFRQANHSHAGYGFRVVCGPAVAGG